ncbi:MAG: hypothetical protein ABSC90_01010 [Acidimicrobiales bacterium]
MSGSVPVTGEIPRRRAFLVPDEMVGEVGSSSSPRRTTHRIVRSGSASPLGGCPAAPPDSSN